MAGVNPAMVTLAREARSMTQTALAEAAGVSQGFISKVENGVVELTPEALEPISDALGFPSTLFMQADRIAGTACLHHRKRQSMPILRLRAIHAQINLTRMQTTRLLNGVEIDPPFEFPRMDVDLYDSVEEIAQLARAHWQVPLGPLNSLIGTIEAAGGIVIRTSFDTDKLDAISQWTPGEHPFFFVNESIPGDRLRWTLAHELGHIIMHGVPSPQQEAEADRFAAEFLMPAREIRPELANLAMPKLTTLKQRWKVSMAALIRRATDLGQISARQQRSFFMRFSQLGYRKNEPFSIPQEQPSLVKKVLEIHRSEHGYSISEMSQAALLFEDEFRDRFLADEAQVRLRLVT
ncbi:MAG: XRE family transcriptional regulator [Actinomycetota bacterium]|nr:XRE family transcriptional regulator [Actinomycetota bacterium]